MATPITVGTTPIIAIARNIKRYQVRFQNVGSTTLYFYRMPGIPSETNYKFKLSGIPGESDNKIEDSIITNSISQFNVVSSGANGKLAIFETIKI